MSLSKKSITAFNDFLDKVSEKQLQEIFDELDQINFEGPTLEQYVRLSALNDWQKFIFKFQPGIKETVPENIKQQLHSFNYQINETSNYDLKSFFFVTSQYGCECNS